LPRVVHADTGDTLARQKRQKCAGTEGGGQVAPLSGMPGGQHKPESVSMPSGAGDELAGAAWTVIRVSR
jgi:hypothetical protein